MRKTLATIGITVLSILQCLTPAFAANTATTQITYTDPGNFTVTIPKTIALNSNKEASYTISITGDVCGGEVVTVTPDSSFTLRDSYGKKDVTATVKQEKTKFSTLDINGTEAAKKQATGKITASGLTAGNWSGALKFNIDKKFEPGLYDNNGALVCSWEKSGIDIEATRGYQSKEPDSAYHVLTNTYKTATTVVIPDGITKIGNGAFQTCSNLKSVIIPNSVTSIGEEAFSRCTSLTSVTIPDSVTSIGRWAFYFCTSLTSVIIPNSVTSIGDYAFYNNESLISVTIPESITSIGYSVFDNCSSLISVTIPNSVTIIENGAFSDCSSLASVTYKGIVYTNRTALKNALKTNNVTIRNDIFNNTALTY